MFRKAAFCVILISALMLIIKAHQTDCPFNLVNDPYPGKCARYVDIDSNGICDLSEISINADSADTVYEVNGTDTYEDIIDTAGMNNINSNTHDETVTDLIIEEITGNGLNETEEGIAANDRYAFKIILPLWIAIMVITGIAKNTGKIKLRVINQFWNWMLLLSFIPVSLTSILLVLRELGIVSTAPVIDSIYIHNMTGIVFILSSIAHIYIKWTYYRNCLKKRKCEDE